MRPVEAGQEDGGQVLITKGLYAGERVIVDGQLKVQPGSKVQLVDENGSRCRPAAVGTPSMAIPQGLAEGAKTPAIR